MRNLLFVEESFMTPLTIGGCLGRSIDLNTTLLYETMASSPLSSIRDLIYWTRFRLRDEAEL